MLDEHALIDLVKEHEELFNRDHPDYVNQVLRDNIWREIAEKLGEHGSVCKERWSRIRENFRKAIILRKQKMESGIKYRPPKYYSRLGFVLPYLSDDSSFTLDVQDTTDANIDDENSDMSLSSPIPRKIIKRSNSTADLSNHEEGTREPTEEVMVYDTQVKQTRTDHVLTEFFVNMANTVARFPVKKQLEIKEKLFHMVHAVEVDIATNGKDFLF